MSGVNPEGPPSFPAGPVSRDDVVSWLRSQPDQADFLRACYQDQPEVDAAERFRCSDEWQAALKLLPSPQGWALDLGGGNGIASYALAGSGWCTASVEPSPSPITGGPAITDLLQSAGLPARVVSAVGERLPFLDETFDVVYSRQVLHHVGDQAGLCAELRRVLRPGGTYLACAEHVVSSDAQRHRFLSEHPMHCFTQDEDAFRLADYRRAFAAGGLDLVRILRPFDSPINIAPRTKETLRDELARRFARLPAGKLAARAALSRQAYPAFLRLLSRLDRRPGRSYTFVARRS